MAAHHLKAHEFNVFKEDKSTPQDTNIIFSVPNPRPGVPNDQSCLGFIRFSGKNNRGVVELVNRGATLEPKHLDFGETTKTGGEDLAGAHGEGLKISLLVLMRGHQNHRVRCISGEFTWNFNFTSAGKLVARLTRMSETAIRTETERSRALHRGNKIPFIVSPLVDIKFVIGEKGQGYDGIGHKRQRDPVTLNSFNHWCKSTLFLQNLDTSIKSLVKTSQGDLILEESLRGNLYLKGLLLKESKPGFSASLSGRRLKFGYNFSHGKTNRERQSVRMVHEESRAIMAIWNKVLQKEPSLVRDLSDMLLATNPEWADVFWAQHVIKVETAVCLKNHLFSDASKWYYSRKEATENPLLNAIIQGFGREGFELPDIYWEVLVNNKLAHTAEQEQQKLFDDSETALVPSIGFPHDVQRLLRACLRGCSQTHNTTVHFVQAGQLHLHTYYVEKDDEFKIHDRWLSKEKVVEELGLSDNLPELDVVFHAVQWLFAEIINQLPSAKFFDQTDHHSKEWHRRRAINVSVQRLLEYVRSSRSITLRSLSSSSNQLVLEWNSSSACDEDATAYVQLHNEASCTNIRQFSLTSDFDPDFLPCCMIQDSTDQDVNLAKCSSTTLQLSVGSHSFENLDAGTTYFAIMAKVTDPGSIPLITEFCEVPRPPAITVDLTDMDEDFGSSISESDDDIETTPPASIARPGHSQMIRNITNEINQTRPLDSRVQINSTTQPAARVAPPSAECMEGSTTPAHPQNQERVNGNTLTDLRTSNSYRCGSTVSKLDILEPRDWFEAESDSVVGAIIGIPKPRPNNLKRQRDVDEASVELGQQRQPREFVWD